jgi:hypothetical protein
VLLPRQPNQAVQLTPLARFVTWAVFPGKALWPCVVAAISIPYEFLARRQSRRPVGRPYAHCLRPVLPTASSLSTPASGAADSQALGGFTQCTRMRRLPGRASGERKNPRRREPFRDKLLACSSNHFDVSLPGEPLARLGIPRRREPFRDTLLAFARTHFDVSLPGEPLDGLEIPFRREPFPARPPTRLCS